MKVTVKNVGKVALQAVTVNVTGATYKLGDLAPGAERSTVVKVSGDSSVSVGFLDTNGRAVQLDADCYFESRYVGNIDIEMTDRSVERVTQKHWP